MGGGPSVELLESKESMKTRERFTSRAPVPAIRWATGAVFAAAVVFADAPLQAVEAVNIGATSVIIRTVTGKMEEQVRRLAVEDGVHQNEVIATAPESGAEIVFLDGTKISLGPNVRMTLDRFVFDPEPGRGTFVMTATEGVFRFFSGTLDNSAYVIKTPTATIGIRGTIFTGVILPDGTTAVTLEAASSWVTVQSFIGQNVKLITPGTGTIVFPDGNMTPPGMPPDWALALLDGLNDLLDYLPQIIPAAGPSGRMPVITLPPIDGIPENPCQTVASVVCP